jgi:hypothetical protein
MDYQKLLDNLRRHPANRDNRQKRIARLVLRVCRKIRALGLNANRPVCPKVCPLD